jgi:5'-nucleotidase
VNRLPLVLLVACSQGAGPEPVKPPPPSGAARTLTIIGTNDLHGALDRLPLIAGFIANVRAARTADGGGVLLLDAGDLFQGTLESNLAEGADIVRAYNRIGYSASAVGNHEFDYGPVGPEVTIKSPSEDPRGALEARLAEAKFPFLAANITDSATSALPTWPNIHASTLVEVAGIKVGIIGASTESTPYTTMPQNFKGLAVSPAAPAIEREAKALRARGAQVIVVTAHIGSECKEFDHPDDVATCDRKAELFAVLDALPKGTIDVFVAGHTHAAVAHRIDGVATIESYSSGRAFGRVDISVVGDRIAGVTMHPPELVCPLDAHGNPAPVAECHPKPYEGRPVVADAEVQKIVDEAIERAGAKRQEKLGVTLAGAITKAYGTESAEGDLMTELMLAARPDADVAMTNGGGLRADLPPGELTYGQLFAAVPFDNRFALVEVSGKQLHEMVAKNLQKGGGILSWAGLTAKAHCKDKALEVAIDVRGKPLDPAARYTIATSDFLASGGDGMFGKGDQPTVKPTDAIIRDSLADVLRARKGMIDPASYATKRLDYPGRRPVHCGGKATHEDDSE